MNFPRFEISCCHVTNSRDKNERSLLMKTVLQSKATIIKNLRPFETRIYFSNFISKVKNEHSWN